MAQGQHWYAWSEVWVWSARTLSRGVVCWALQREIEVVDLEEGSSLELDVTPWWAHEELEGIERRSIARSFLHQQIALMVS